jgi:hypothetical protein
MVRQLACAVLMSMAANASAGAAHWQPTAGTTFSIILSVSLATVTTSAEVVDLDLFETKLATIASLSASRRR